MFETPLAARAAATAWAIYGIRDAIVFAVGFVLALMLIMPFA